MSELREAIAKAAFSYDGHVTHGSLDEVMKVVEAFVRVPRCPRCNSVKLGCPDGHTWEVE